MLLRDSMGVPDRGYFRNPWTSTDLSDFRDVGRYLEELNEGQNWIIDRLCLREYYDEINKLLGGRITSHLHWRRREIEKGHEGQTEAENDRNLVYGFITSTQDLARETDIQSPFIFDLTITKADSSENYNLQVGFVSTSAITLAKLSFREMKEPSEENLEKESPKKPEDLEIPKKSGLHIVPIQGFEKGKKYDLQLQVRNEKGESDHMYLISYPKD